MNLSLLRSSAIAAACVATLAVLGLMPARAGAGSDRVVRLTRCGPQRTDASTAPAHPYEETAPVSVLASQDLDTKVVQGDSPVRARRAPRATAAAWWGALAELSSPTHAPPGRLAATSQIPSSPFSAPTSGRAPPAS
jgi:hypothetical protein